MKPNHVMGEIPKSLTIIGIVLSILSIAAIIFACKILFL